MTTWLNDFKTAKKLIQSVLRDNEKTRGDDKELILTVWEKQGLKLDESQKALFKKVLPPETITRARRKIQETGLFKPRTVVYEQRQILEKEVRSGIND